MKSLLVLLGLSAVASATRLPVPSDSITGENVADEFLAKSLFDKFKLDHSKSYHSASEETHRYSIFRSNLARIADLNSKNGSPSFGITPFADLTAREFAKTHLGFKPSLDEESQTARLNTPVFELDEDDNMMAWGANNTLVDWRQKGAVTKVKDQAQCGSCWAFSATEQIETAWYLAKGTLPVLSPQQIVSCDKTDAGCDGGDTPTAYAYVKSAGGLESESAYPYSSGAGNTGTCKFKAASIVAKISGFSYATPPCSGACKTQDEATFANNVAAKGPASICVNAESWQLYSSGVLTAKACGGSAYTDLDHCVQLVGYNKPASGKSYWIVRNSWGASWGYSGYLYVEYGTNACGVADEATFVTI